MMRIEMVLEIFSLFVVLPPNTTGSPRELYCKMDLLHRQPMQRGYPILILNMSRYLQIIKHYGMILQLDSHHINIFMSQCNRFFRL